jgi:hypothetical protein
VYLALSLSLSLSLSLVYVGVCLCVGGFLFPTAGLSIFYLSVAFATLVTDRLLQHLRVRMFALYLFFLPLLCSARSTAT